MRKTKPLLLAAAFGIAASALAEAPPRRLGAPTVMKLDWDVDSVRAADIDGDGRTDLAALNNSTGRIELLLRLKPGEKPPAPRTLREDRWQPVLDDAPFRRLSVSGSVDMGSLAPADLDGDGRIDIAYTSSRDPLTVVSRDKSGEWTARRTFTRYDAAPGSNTLATADLDGDGRRELVMLSKSGLLVFPKFTAGDPIPEPKLYATGADNPGGLSVADIDGDGRPDIAYVTRGDKPELRVRFGLASGGFGPERAFRTEYASVNLETRLPAHGGGTGFAGVSLRKRALEIFDIRRDDGAFDAADSVSPALYSPASALKSPALATLADEGRTLLVGDARGAAIHIYRRAETGSFAEPVAFPAPANLTAIASGDFDGKGLAVLTLGEKDGALGIARFDDKGRLGFPSEIRIDGTPVAIAAAKPAGASRSVAYVVSKDAGEVKKVRLLTLACDDKGVFSTADSVELDSAAKDAEGAIVGVVDGRRVVIIPCGRVPAQVLREKPDGKLEVVAKDSAPRKGMLSGIGFSDIGFGDTDGDGKTELLVAAPGFIRALTLDAEGDLVVKDQFNTRRPGDKPRCPVVVKFKGESAPGLIFYNETDKGLEWLAPDDKGVFRYRRTVETGALDPQALLTSGPAGLPRLLHVGRDRIAETDLAVAGLKLAVLDRFETDLPGIVHGAVEIGKFTGGASPDLVLMDTRSHHLELVRRTGEGVWKSSLHFPLFDENPFYRGRRNAGAEPHDGLRADLDGDGFPELVLLMHDRLLVYPSVPAKTADGK